MKKLILITLTFVLFSFTSFANPGKKNKKNTPLTLDTLHAMVDSGLLANITVLSFDEETYFVAVEYLDKAPVVFAGERGNLKPLLPNIDIARGMKNSGARGDLYPRVEYVIKSGYLKGFQPTKSGQVLEKIRATYVSSNGDAIEVLITSETGINLKIIPKFN